jgi:hypothetical protein
LAWFATSTTESASTSLPLNGATTVIAVFAGSVIA